MSKSAKTSLPIASSGTPPRKLDKLLAFMAAGRWDRALSLAASWPDLGEQRERIRAAAAAQLSPGLYRGMGKDPDALVADGVLALRERYVLEPVLKFATPELVEQAIAILLSEGWPQAPRAEVIHRAVSYALLAADEAGHDVRSLYSVFHAALQERVESIVDKIATA